MKRNTAHSTALMFGAYVAAAAFDYAFGAGMSWFLTPEEYGVLGVALSFFLLLSFFVASGFPTSLAKLLAETDHAPGGLLRYALAGNLLLAATVAGLFVALVVLGPLNPGPGYTPVLAVVAGAVVLLSLGSTLQFALQGRMAFAEFAVLHASKSVNKVLFGIPLVLLGLGVAGALGGLLAGALLLLAGAAFLLRRHGGTLRGPALSREERHRFLRYTFAVFVGSLALTLLMSLDVLSVKYLTTDPASDRLTAYYQSAAILTKAPLWAVLAGMGVFFPLMSRTSRENPAAANRLAARVLRWTVLALAPAVALLTLFPEAALGILFPPEYAAAAPALRTGAVGMGALSVCFVLTRALQASGRARSPGVFLGASAALQGILLVVLVPEWGAVGAAAATTAGCVAGALLAGAVSMRAFQSRPTTGWVLRLSVSLTLLAGVVALLAPTGRVETLGAFAAGGIAYAMAILGLGLIAPDERRALGNLLPFRDRTETHPGDA